MFLLWDFDGTLATRPGGWIDALLSAAHDHGFGSVTAAEIRPHLASGFPWHTPGDPHTDISTAEEWWGMLRPVFTGAYRAAGLDDEAPSEIAAAVRDTYLDPDAWESYDEAAETLAGLADRGWEHAILSNHVPELPGLVRDLRLDDHFEAIYTSGTIGYEKPHPAIFEHALDRLGDGPVRMIGDSVSADVEGARRVGIPAVLVHSEDESVQYRCERLAEIPSELQRI
ncbi:HAD family hydrolase [Halapricum hydrolyticum]|uniref:HAD-IA family hydrolase n=1 Tax=Halapricum hydrolyticum TaxID=2979991 RepID=A0AAE3LF10_9EURY|nr:HAD-IA family hydrolase [Halapricum hydrolyticum]MCU4717901.1 HAD-IA family hydrolase [Halapricum hydrolyticum]MCU4727066.1 HAD-IA family hydrolase [Halapricum hydrolyticum]